MKWITSNPAKAAGIYEETGSLQVGKNADVVLWSQNPFSVYALAEKVYIDGAIAFDKEKGLVPNSDFDLGILNPTKNRIQE
jgi:imidazolonepropionase-like amidohydrolase